jgi:Nucleotidyl transferase AbiEii toxin, Type IV TA system
MTGEPEEVPPLVDIDMGLPRPTYRAYPVADHIADKLCAMLETHPRATGERVESTRYRDLVDLATFARSSAVDGDALAIALRSESARRGLKLPHRLPIHQGPTGVLATHAPLATPPVCPTATSTPHCARSARCSTHCSQANAPGTGTPRA